MHTIELGDVTVTRLAHVDNWPLSSAGFFPGTVPAHWQANRSWLAPDHWDAEADRVHVAVRTWLLRSGGRTILVDTGLDPSSTRHGVPAGAPLPAVLATAGVKPEDVDLVICTHLHADHVGGNTLTTADGDRVPAFPRARYLISRPDLDFFHPDNLTEEPGRSATVFAASIEPLLRSGQAQIWDDSYVIDDHLRLALTPGHTPGHAMVTLESGSDRAAFVGDLLHSPIQIAEPGLSSCFCHAPAEAARSRRKVLGWAADDNALILPAHFGGAGAVEIRRAGPGFKVHRWAEFSGDRRDASRFPGSGKVPPIASDG
jgi:glyoxylase-like metal-dependent hydrolase (beta-lactamase superfamily II)